MHAPQIVWIVLAVLGLGVDLERHGREKTGTYSFGVSLFGVAISASILYWGGFFN